MTANDNKVYKVWNQELGRYWCNDKVWKKRGHAQAAITNEYSNYYERQNGTIKERVAHLAIHEFELMLVNEIPASSLMK